jgi:FkbM family methyltransferase
MKIRSRSSIIRRVARRIGRRLFQCAENNDDARMANNGEAWLLRALAADWARTDRSVKRVVIDAGANRGDFTAVVLAAADQFGVQIEVHAFEPGPSAATELVARFANEPRVAVVNTAVSDFEGSAALFDSAGSSSFASLVQRGAGTRDLTPEVTVTTIAAFLARSGLERVDFLKLDIEGAELAALRGLGDRLVPEKVAVIQFEYGGTTLDAGNRLRDFFELFEARGYRIAKLFPAWVETRDYAPWMDGFSYANWVAFRRHRDA